MTFFSFAILLDTCLQGGFSLLLFSLPYASLMDSEVVVYLFMILHLFGLLQYILVGPGHQTNFVTFSPFSSILASNGIWQQNLSAFLMTKRKSILCNSGVHVSMYDCAIMTGKLNHCSAVANAGHSHLTSLYYFASKFSVSSSCFELCSFYSSLWTLQLSLVSASGGIGIGWLGAFWKAGTPTAMI